MNDSDVQEWIQKHGSVTSFAFIVNSAIDGSDLNTLYAGLRFLQSESITKFIFIEDEIDFETAQLFGVKRGHKLQIIFPGDQSHKEEEVKSIILQGLDHLRLEGKYWGCF